MSTTVIECHAIPNGMAPKQERLMDIYEVVTKLIGPVNPVGEIHTDNDRLENLAVMTDLIEKLILDIGGVVPNKDRIEFSLRRAGEHAAEFMYEAGVEVSHE